MARLGQQVDVFCGRCKVERYHTVAALSDDGRIEKIVCGYCHTERKYKDPAKKPSKRATSSTPATRTRAARETVDVDLTTPAKPYTPKRTFTKGDALQHEKYGRGKVMEVRGDRIDVRFADGSTRVFVHSSK